MYDFETGVGAVVEFGCWEEQKLKPRKWGVVSQPIVKSQRKPQVRTQGPKTDERGEKTGGRREKVVE